MKQRYVDIIGLSGVEEDRTPEEIKGQIVGKLKALGGD